MTATIGKMVDTLIPNKERALLRAHRLPPQVGRSNTCRVDREGRSTRGWSPTAKQEASIQSSHVLPTKRTITFPYT